MTPRFFTTAAAFLLLSLVCQAQEASTGTVDTSAWRNPNKPIPERVQALISQLTLKEKISFLSYSSPGVARLGIPPYDTGDECLHGIVRPGKFTVFPEAIGMAATFDPGLINQEATAISDEARAKYNATGGKPLGYTSDVLTFWSPVVNMARDPRWGRTQETYGEDPFLTSRLGVAFVEGLQGNDPRYLKSIATPKHFAGNNEESGRFGKNIVADERYLQEYELQPFRACIEEAKAESIMSAYTAINGVPSSANKWLLTDVLRGQWGFQGYVASDSGAVFHVMDAFHYAKTPEEAVADCFNAGLDMESGKSPSAADDLNNALPKALQEGLIKPEVLDLALTRVLTAHFMVGMYDPPALVPYSKIPPEVIGSPEHIALARKVADESIVLLKNDPAGEEPLLPIHAGKIKKIVVIGPNAKSAQFGDYSGSPTIEAVTPLAGIQARAGKDGITVTSLPWYSDVKAPVPSDVLKPEGDASRPGLTGVYYDSPDLSGTPSVTQIDPQVNFSGASGFPKSLDSEKKFSARWSGKIQVARTGQYFFTLKGGGAFRLTIDGKTFIDAWGKSGAGLTGYASGMIDLATAGDHAVTIDYRHSAGEKGLVWSWCPPASDDSFAPLKDADLVIAFMGLKTNIEKEGKDRTTIELPADQEDFLDKVLAQNPRTAVVLESGSSLALSDFKGKFPAMLQAWYPGEEGGDGIADVLFGDYNPAGRLPLTFYASDAQLRPMAEYDVTKGRTYLYLPDKPLYPFGYGLSYTSFTYANLKLSKPDATANDKVTVSVDVTNSGPRDGEEVVQCYVHARQSSVPMPIKQLWAFQRVALTKGQTKTVSLELETKNFGHWDKATQHFLVEPGAFDILVGASSDDIRQSTTLNVRNN